MPRLTGVPAGPTVPTVAVTVRERRKPACRPGIALAHPPSLLSSPIEYGHGDQVAAYTLLEPLGKGGFGSVWLAQHADGHEVALKVMHTRFVGDTRSDGSPTIADRMLAEARILGDVKHPGIVGVEDVIDDRDNGVVAYAMERLVGRDLKSCVSELDLPTLVGVFADIAETLAFLHEQGVVHRDVKCANIFVCEGDRPQVKLLDFGIAKELHDRTRLARTAMGMLVGSVATMAPEQFERLVAERDAPITGATDQWALAVTLYGCVSGRLPFGDTTIGNMMTAVMQREPEPLSVLPRYGEPKPASVESLEAVLSRALEKAPTQRFASTWDLAAALRAIVVDLQGADGDNATIHDRPALDLDALAATEPVEVVSCLTHVDELGRADTFIRPPAPVDLLEEPILDPTRERTMPPPPVAHPAPIGPQPLPRSTHDRPPMGEPPVARSQLAQVTGMMMAALGFGFALGWVFQAL